MSLKHPLIIVSFTRATLLCFSASLINSWAGDNMLIEHGQVKWSDVWVVIRDDDKPNIKHESIPNTGARVEKPTWCR